MQSRYYNPTWGRFVSADNISYLGANGDLVGYNLYAYCSNNPVNGADYSGHFAIAISTLLIGMAISAVLGAGTAFVTGAGGYAVNTVINNSVSFEFSDMLIAAGSNTASGVLPFVGGVTGGITGVKVPGVKTGFGSFIKFHSALTWFGVYPSKLLLSRLESALQEVY